MSTETEHTITVGGVRVHVVRKDIKNLHLGVYPPNGRVRVAAPLLVSDDAVRLAIIRRLGWIKTRRAHFENQERQSEREMLTGESHWFLGQRYRLRIVESDLIPSVAIRKKTVMEMWVRPGTPPERRREILTEWYRQELKSRVPALIEKWRAILGVKSAGWSVVRMKTKWGACNTDTGLIRLNLELIKKPERCIEYLVAHELTHLLERHHNDRFVAILDRHLPHWRSLRDELNRLPLGHEEWGE